MESQPQNPEFRNNPENFHPWTSNKMLPMRISIIFFQIQATRKGHLQLKYQEYQLVSTCNHLRHR